jgi:hypothetical protein
MIWAERGLGQVDARLRPRGRPPGDKSSDYPELNVHHDTRAIWRRMAYRFDVRCRRWRGARGRFVTAKRGRHLSDRLQRGLELAVLGHVAHRPDGFRVVSADLRHTYRVDAHGCDCPDAIYRRGVWKHQVAARLANQGRVNHG